MTGAREPLFGVFGVQAGYGQQQVLFEVSMNVYAGETVALIGPNGAGKSTLLRVASGLLPAWSGSVELDRKDVTCLSVQRRLALGVTYVPSGGRVFNSLSVEENLLIVVDCLSTLSKADQLREAYSLFPPLAFLKNRAAWKLSGGERQQLALAQAFLCSPRLMLLDEPSASLSHQAAQLLLSKTRDLQKDTGMSLIVAEQNVEEALNIAERVVVLRSGRVVLDTSTDRVDRTMLAKAFMGVEEIRVSEEER